MKTVLTKAELAERWSVDVRTIDKWEQNKVIQRIDGIPTPRYSVEHIQSIEGIKNLNQFSPVERKRLEIEKLRAVLSNILSESAKVVGI